MLKKHFGKILIFILNLVLLATGVFFIKNREENKVAEENSDVSDAAINEQAEAPTEAEPIVVPENPSQFPLPVQENPVVPAKPKPIVTKPAPAPVKATPAPTTTTKKPKTKTS